jgi:hypothetical protein
MADVGFTEKRLKEAEEAKREKKYSETVALRGTDLVIATAKTDADHKAPTKKEQVSIVERRVVNHAEYRINPINIDFKIPDEAFFEGLESDRLHPISPTPPREGRATFIVKKSDGTIEQPFSDIYLTNINFSDMESVQLHSTFSGPFLHTFDRTPRSLTMSVALPNTKLLNTVLNVEDSTQLNGESKESIKAHYNNIIGNWRNKLRDFYENKMRASVADSVSVKIQGTIYSGHIISLRDVISAESDAVAIGLMEMIVFDVKYPSEIDEDIITTITLKQKQPRENKTEKFIRKRLEKLKREAGILFLDRGGKNTNDREEAIIEGVKEGAA